jgi:hypothetical protein
MEESIAEHMGCKWILLKVRKGKDRWKRRSRESVLLFFRCF